MDVHSVLIDTPVGQEKVVGQPKDIVDTAES